MVGNGLGMTLTEWEGLSFRRREKYLKMAKEYQKKVDEEMAKNRAASTSGSRGRGRRSRR